MLGECTQFGFVGDKPLVLAVVAQFTGFDEAGVTQRFDGGAQFFGVIDQMKGRRFDTELAQSVFFPTPVLTDMNRVRAGRHSAQITERGEQWHADVLFLHGEDIGAAECLIQRRRLAIGLDGDHRSQTINALGILAWVGQKAEAMSHFPARQSEHSRQLAAADNRDMHHSTASGTLAVWLARQD